jgi:hypothetical protein
MGRHLPSPALRQLAELLWCRSRDSSVHVTSREAPADAGWTVAETYLALPSAARARFVVPLDSRRAALGSVLRYNRLRTTPTRLARLGTAAVLASGLERLSGGTVLRVWRDPCATAAGDVAARTLLDHLRSVHGRDDLVLAFGVHELDPNYKPTVQVFDRGGTPVAFAKVGWTTPTGRLVANEARAVRRLDAEDPTDGRVAVPRLLAETTWSGAHVTCLRPLPRSVRRYRGDASGSGAALARVCGPVSVLPLAESDWWRRARDAIGSSALLDGAAPGPRTGLPPDLASGLAAYADALAGAGRPVPMAAWHGDWVPWNLATDGTTTHVFDLEHWAPCAPWGFDLAHWAFQTALVTRGASATEAAAAADASVSSWPDAGVQVPHGRYVVSLYLLELAVRTMTLRAEGGSWNTRLFPDLFYLLKHRLYAGLG